MGRWEESEHPRDRRGRFAGHGGWAGTVLDALHPGGHRYRPAKDVLDEADWDQLGRDADEGIRNRRFPDGDDHLGVVYDLQGYHGQPQVVSRQEMDQLVAQGAPEIWRGLEEHPGGTPAEFAESFRSGGYHYPGRGTFGNGTYGATNRDDALKYSSPREDRGPSPRRASKFDHRQWPGLLRMTLHPDANVVDYEQLVESMGDRLGDDDFESRARRRFINDPGRFAALTGADAIKIKGSWDTRGQGYYVILNRTAVIVQEDQG